MHTAFEQTAGPRTRPVRFRLAVLGLVVAAIAARGSAFAAQDASALRVSWNCTVKNDTRCSGSADGEVHGWKNVRVQLSNGHVAASTIYAKAITGSTVRGYAEASGGYGAARLARACVTPVDPATYWTGSAVHDTLGSQGAINLDSASASPSDSAGVCGQ